MKVIRSVMLAVLGFGCSSGCLPSTKVFKNPGDDDCGVRYYRPKPYLLVKPMTASGGLPVPGFVSIEMVMMPDFSEEYSIHVRSGLGSNETEIKLTDGWRLDALNVNVDSNFDESMKSVAELAKAIPRLTAADSTGNKMSIRATNVPLGYYEAVVSAGRDCKKRLYGFRYIGFMPYAACPIESCGTEQHSCYGSETYALLFEDGAMVFRPLHEAADSPAVLKTANPSSVDDGKLDPPVIGEVLLAPVEDSV